MIEMDRRELRDIEGGAWLGTGAALLFAVRWAFTQVIGLPKLLA